MTYTPEQHAPIKSLADLEDAFYRELSRIREAFDNNDVLILSTLHVAPDKTVVGQIVLADGTDWDPGSGAGVYRWNGAAWIFLG